MMSSGPHHQVPLTQAQVAQQQQQSAMQFEMAKRRSRKPTDKNLPDGIDDCIVGDMAQRYRELRDFERRLDASMTRKRLDIVDSVNRGVKRWKTLRIWITNTADDQNWQASGGLNVDTFDFSSNLEPSYKVKIEGRLLDDDDDLDHDEATKEGDEGAKDADRMDEDTESPSKPTKQPRYRFSHFFKAMSVDFPAIKGNAESSVEWKKPERTSGSANATPQGVDFDELTFNHSGDENLTISINLTRHEDPERYALSPVLEDIVDMQEGTRQEVVMAVWEYIKFMGLCEDEEKRNFRCDDILRHVFNIETGAVPKLAEYISPHLQPLPPVQLPYTIRLDEEFHKNPQPTVYDVRVAVDDPLREQMSAFLTNPGYASMLKEVASLDEQLAIIIQAIHVSKAKHDFLSSLSKDPANFIRNWLSSQKRDLDVILGEAMRGSDEPSGDEWRKGGPDSIWGTINARESVNAMLARQQAQPPRQ
ncbi:hypothetical protein GGR57DRAFT_81495 [Xylariaceae sp. FL1272]|nr:hypothetical protein GGR57DRAFT_81495 [Xylariaceae sp. FL1272]